MNEQSKPVYALFAVILTVVVAFMAYIFGSYFQLTQFVPANITVPAERVSDKQPEANSSDQGSTNEETPSPTLPANQLAVKWQKREEVKTPDVFKTFECDPTRQDCSYPVYQPSGTTYKVGTVTGGEFDKADVLLVFMEPDGPTFGGLPLYRLIRAAGKPILLTKQSGDGSYYFDDKKVSFREDVIIKDLALPDQFVEPTAKETLQRDAYMHEDFSTYGLKKAFVLAGYGQFYTTDPATDWSVGTARDSAYLNSSNGFIFAFPDGVAAVYKAVYAFTGENGVPSFTYSDGRVNVDPYYIMAVGGCGARDYGDVVDPKNLDLIVVGTSSDGRDIFKSNGKEDQQELQALYDNYWVPEGETKISYEAFLAYPVRLYFKDGFGRTIRMTSAKFIPPAECGKPVIYLYPETKQNVSVQLEPQGGFSYTEPAYGQGWNVVAYPDGRIVNKADGQTYPYLFWEGRGGLFESSTDNGWVVAKDDVESFLRSSLHDLGLNNQEANDFVEFWLPRMQKAPYYFVTFFGTSTMDQLAPLTVTPKPDTIIRILMDYKELDAPIQAHPFPLKSLPREGFAVVEWGGVLR